MATPQLRAEALIREGTELMHLHDLAAAEAVLLEALRVLPDSGAGSTRAACHLQLGVLALVQERFPEAASYVSLLSSLPGLSDLFGLSGLYGHVSTHNSGKSEVILSPPSAYARFTSSRYFSVVDDAEEPSVWQHRGVLAYCTGDLAAGIGAYRHLMALEPGNTEAMSGLAACFEEQVRDGRHPWVCGRAECGGLVPESGLMRGSAEGELANAACDNATRK